MKNLSHKIVSVTFYDSLNVPITNISPSSILKRSFKTEFELKNFLVDLIACKSPVYRLKAYTNYNTQFTITKSIRYED